MPSDFAIETSGFGRDGVVVAVTGEIDLFTTPEFKAAVDGVFDIVEDVPHSHAPAASR